jgi:hypothetical protein
MLADSLTKSMDSSMLRECLRTGRYSLWWTRESETTRFKAWAASVVERRRT